MLIQLGDRHLDNILMTTEDCHVLHIDFDCIFGKGKTLPVPEVVDFRLTLNILASLGLTSCFGLFRKYFLVTAKAFARNKENILGSFRIFDVDPIKEHLRARKFRRVDLIASELDKFGQLESARDLNMLLNKNQNIERLKEMFIGWCPHI